MSENGNFEYEIAKRYIPLYFSNGVNLSDQLEGYKMAELSPVEADIILRFNELHNINSVWSALKEEYNISDSHQEVQGLFHSYVNNLISTGILKPGHTTRPILGAKGACYPILVSIELTNKCNFQCTHCYKEATQQNDCFIDTDLVCQALEDLKGKAWSVELTGGEALLHPDFEKIVESADFPVLTLLTNGSLINRVSMKTLKKFAYVQISVYGDSVDEYIKYAQSNSFHQVCENIKWLIDAGIEVSIAIILRKSNYLQLENYIRILSNLGVKYVRFGLTTKTGRNVSPQSEWDLSFEECCELDKELQKLRERFPNIELAELNWQGNFVPLKSTNDPHTIKCGAGRKSIVLSEKGIVRPCNMLPAEYFGKLHWTQYINIARSGGEVSYDDCVSTCLAACKKEGTTLASICRYGFE